MHFEIFIYHSQFTHLAQQAKLQTIFQQKHPFETKYIKVKAIRNLSLKDLTTTRFFKVHV